MKRWYKSSEWQDGRFEPWTSRLRKKLVQQLKALHAVVSPYQVVEATVWKSVSCITSKGFRSQLAKVNKQASA